MKRKQNRKKSIYLFTTALILFLAAFQINSFFVHASQLEGSATKETGKITTESLNVRSGPGKNYDAIGKVYSSETVTVIGSEDGWYRIDYNGTEGYVSAKYVDLEEASGEEANSSSLEQTKSENEDGEEDEVVSPLLQYKIPIIVLVILVVVAVMIITLRSIQKLDEDDEEDEYDEEEDEYDDDEYDEEEYDEDEYDEDEYDEDEYDEEEDEYDKRRRHSNVRRPVYDESAKKKELNLLYSNNPDDFRIDIDPEYFEDEDTIPSKRAENRSEKDADLQRAMEKMEELQREIERIKNRR